jgi:hypothetical protein
MWYLVCEIVCSFLSAMWYISMYVEMSSLKCEMLIYLIFLRFAPNISPNRFGMFGNKTIDQDETFNASTSIHENIFDSDWLGAVRCYRSIDKEELDVIAYWSRSQHEILLLKIYAWEIARFWLIQGYVILSKYNAKKRSTWLGPKQKTFSLKFWFVTV